MVDILYILVCFYSRGHVIAHVIAHVSIHIKKKQNVDQKNVDQKNVDQKNTFLLNRLFLQFFYYLDIFVTPLLFLS